MEEHKICSNCIEDKPISEYSKKYKTKDGTQKYQSICKKCVNEKDKERSSTKEFKEKRHEYDVKFYKENREKILKEKKEYHIENREEILQKKKEYRDIPEIKEKNRLYIKDYMKNNREKYYEYRRKNPHIIAWRNILYRTLRYLGTEKEGHTQDILGYSAVQLKHRIDEQLREGMTWGNYGKWEIDHIKPLTSFDLNADPSEVNALSNLQPLWKEENIAKYNHII
jgi:hypothetical protein